MASSGSGRNGSSGEERQGIQPRYRRAFGCVTWINMAMLVFLAAAFLLPLPFRYVGDGTIFREIPERLTFVGLILILPGMAIGAALGARTYRVERRLGIRVGAGIGAIIGWTSFFVPAWLDTLPLLLLPLAALAAGLVLYALFATDKSFELRRRLVLIAAGLVAVAGAFELIVDFDVLGLTGAFFSTAAAAVGGWIAGSGYARAGGDAMIPPGATIKPREPRRKPR
ncbi:MAG TPA: hypothetical protein VFJ72_07735 [Rubrobacteraceae bacterium]|nr:hypothetical protein [Rubrobacteraceae bacterium]